ncbi:hypothetical protein [Butyrivibrio proteoclasticus]|uniref:hypothetical protein n=1 Tax=Butyrivibrio proteoclasticus TaxID=43305 RepID=UPI00047DD6A9|nr:hypothetical protein [Butyrivibrio proteoclasticus]
MAPRFSRSGDNLIRITDNFYRVFSIFIFVGILVLFFTGISLAGKNSIEKQQESLESAIARDIVQCYSIEGRYPPSLEYLQEHYGLTYDDETFFVDYRPIGSNLYPDVTVIKIRKGENGS